jgi:predicted metal-dependent enzyme (double-stranded beta helix superfamily)
LGPVGVSWEVVVSLIERASGNHVLNDLVRSVRSVLAVEPEPEKWAPSLARILRPFLGNPRLLTPEQRQPNPERYRQHILHVEETGAFSVVALVWLPGQSTTVHDHLSWCVIGVHQGREHEVSYEVIREGGEEYLLPIGESTHHAGSVAALQPPGDIHTVFNPGPEMAISIHIYGVDVRKLGSSIRRRYDLPVVESRIAV